MKYLYFYIGPDGVLKPNDQLYPVDLLRAITGDKEGLFFRFAFQPDSKKIFIQDESFRNKLRAGDEQSWTFFNHALDNLNKKANARFLDRSWGDPQDSGVTRPISHYASCWRDLHEILNEEFNVTPIDINVYEYIALPDRDEKIALLQKGSKIGDLPVEQPMIGLNRKHSSLLKEGDISFSSINKALLLFYLTQMPQIFKALGKHDLVNLTKTASSPKTMFAIREKDSTRIFNGKEDIDEEKVRTSLTSYNGPVVIFDLDHGTKKVCFRNRMLSDLSDPEHKPIYEDVMKSCGRILKVPRSEIFTSFDHHLSTGFVSRLSRLPIPWTILREANEMMPDIPVVILPYSVDTKIIKNTDEEDDKCKLFRASRGIDLPYPFLIMSSRMGKGKASRHIVDKCLEYSHNEGSEQDLSEEEFLEFLEKTKPTVKKDMRFLIGAGLSKKDVLDFFAKEFNLFKRAEYRKIYQEVLNETGKPKERKVTASMGMGLQINEHYVAIQDFINDAEHTNDKKGKKPVAGPVKKHVPPRSYEQLLRMKHDREMSSMKTTEQLLRESQM